MLRNIRLLYLHNFLTDFLPEWPFLVIYFANMTGSYTTAMSILATETLSAALFDIPSGIFSDRLGRRLTMTCGSCSCAVAATFYALAHSSGFLYMGAVLWGLGMCLFSGNNNALLYESLKSEGMESRFAHYRGSTGSMFQLALCTSAFLSMWLSTFGLRTVFVVAIIPQVLAAIASLFFIEPRQHETTKPKGLFIFKQACVKTWKNPHLFWLVMAKSISYGGGESKFKFQSAYVAMLWPVWAVGLYRGLNHGIGFFGFHFAARLIERFGEPILFIGRDLYWLISQLLAIVLNNVVSPLMILSGAFLFGPGEVASDHLMQKEFTDDERATMGSIASFATSIVFALAALCLGIVTDAYGTRVGITLGVVLGALSTPINIGLFRKTLFKAK